MYAPFGARGFSSSPPAGGGGGDGPIGSASSSRLGWRGRRRGDLLGLVGRVGRLRRRRRERRPLREAARRDRRRRPAHRLRRRVRHRALRAPAGRERHLRRDGARPLSVVLDRDGKAHMPSSAIANSLCKKFARRRRRACPRVGPLQRHPRRARVTSPRSPIAVIDEKNLLRLRSPAPPPKGKISK